MVRLEQLMVVDRGRQEEPPTEGPPPEPPPEPGG